MTFDNEISLATREKQDEILERMQFWKRDAVIFDTPGTHQWVCPMGITTIWLSMIGGGSSGVLGGISSDSEYEIMPSSNGGGHGGAYIYKYPVKVTSGRSYPLVVGAGGQGFTWIPPNNALPANNSKAGSATSAFGIICNGGSAASMSVFSVNQATSNHRMARKGAVSNLYTVQNAPNQSIISFGETPFGKIGLYASLASNGAADVQFGGAAGFGDGGAPGKIASDNEIIGYGAGSGNVVINHNKVVSGKNYSIPNGGNGIIIIEW